MLMLSLLFASLVDVYRSSDSTSYINCFCPVVVHASMVHKVTKPSNGPSKFQSHQGSPSQSNSRPDAPIEPQVKSTGMQNIRERLIKRNIPRDITDVIMRSWREGTQKQYNVYLWKWDEFCVQRQINSVQTSSNEVLGFLHDLSTKGLSYSAVNSARSALSNYFMGENLSDSGFSVATHPLIKRYMKGVFNSRSPSPRYSEIWDVQPVLSYLALMYPLDKLTLKELSFELVVLQAITSGQRCQTLTNLDISSMKKTEKYYLFQFKNHMKQNRPGHLVNSLYVPKYCEQELCTYRTLEYYLERTLPVRAVEHIALLLSYMKPFAPVGSSTVGRSIKNLLEQSGVDTSVFKAHRTRAASASKANQTVGINAVLKHIGWSTESTFRKFY